MEEEEEYIILVVIFYSSDRPTQYSGYSSQFSMNGSDIQHNTENGENHSMFTNCWLTEDNSTAASGSGDNWTRLDMYRLMLTLFMVLLGPFTAFSVQKTKYLQITTAICRWCGRSLLIRVLCIFPDFMSVSLPILMVLSS